MQRFSLSILLIFAAGAGTIHSAGAVEIAFDVEDAVVVGPPADGFAGVAGQTMSYLRLGATQGELVADCAILVGACSQSTGSITVDQASTDDFGYLNGIESATAGNDAVQVDSSVTCVGPCPAAQFHLVGAGDYQQLSVSVTGTGTLPEFVEVDITYSLTASVIDNSTVAAGNPYGAGAYATVRVIDPTGYVEGSVFSFADMPFSAIATSFSETYLGVDPLQTGSDGVTNDTQTFLIRPNEPYWVGLYAQYSLLLPTFGIPRDPSYDYAGLDLTFSAFADPTFTINPNWLNANPGFSATITRTLNAVPELAAIDIKPGSDTNRINPKSRGITQVAVLGSIDFDATQVDPSTVVFGPGEASPIHGSRIKDVNRDFFPDMLLRFKTEDIGIVCGDTEATLSAETFNGEQFSATDSILTVGCEGRDHHDRHNDDHGDRDHDRDDD